jgi:acetyl esterase/lipase
MSAASRFGSLFTCAIFCFPLAAKSQVPDDVRKKLLEIGFGSSLEPSMAIYEPLLAAAPKGDLVIEKDLRYGENERNLLDLYRPRGIEGAAVLVYVHGGGYRTGDRDLNPLVYANIPTYFARHGLLAMSATYRLAPEAGWPSGAEDMHALVAWVRSNARAHGGDPDRIFLMGHSAGATHAASYAFDARFQPPEGHGLAGIVLVSGRYRLRWDPDDPSLDSIREYFGNDPAQYESRSAIPHVPGSEVPALLVVAEYDQRNLVETTGELFVALCERDDGRCPRFLQLRHHNHLSEVIHINTGDEILGREILDFIQEGARRQLENARAR